MYHIVKPNVTISAPPGTVRLYWIATGLFTLLFVASIILTFGDLETSYFQYARLGFANWVVFFNGTAKFLGLIAILYNQSRTLKEFAFAGFLFDIILAMTTHIIRQDTYLLVAIFGLVVWIFAFVMHRRVYPINDKL